MPQSKAALATVAMFAFFAGWTDVLGPLIYLNTDSKYPISLALAGFAGAYGYAQPNPQAAAILISALPCAVLVFVGQRYFNRGIVFSGVQE